MASTALSPERKTSKASKGLLGLAAVGLALGTALTSGGVSYALWNTTAVANLPAATIKLHIPTATVSWQGASPSSVTLFDGKEEATSLANLPAVKSDKLADTYAYRALPITLTSPREGTLKVTTVSDMPLLSGSTSSDGATKVPTWENLRLVDSASACTADAATTGDLPFTKNAVWSGPSVAPGKVLCVTQKRQLLETRAGSVIFSGKGVADEPVGALPPSPAVPTDTTSASAPVYQDMAAPSIPLKLNWTLTAGPEEAPC